MSPTQQLTSKLVLPKWALQAILTALAGAGAFLIHDPLLGRGGESVDVQIAVLQTSVEGINKNLDLMREDLKDIRRSLRNR